MKSIFTYAFLAVLVLSLSACEKTESILTGRLTYKGAISGIEYVAENTEIKLHLGSLNGSPFKTITTDSDGYFQFQGLWAAEWHIYATTNVNGFNYQGTAFTTAINGVNVVTLDLMME